MAKLWLSLLVLLWHGGMTPVKSVDPAIEEEEIRARAYVKYLDQKISERDNMVALVSWEYATNLTNQNLMRKLVAAEAALKETKEEWEETKKFNWVTYRDPDLKRQFKRFTRLDEQALPEDKYKKLMKIITDMQDSYSTTKICELKNGTKCDLEIDEILKIMKFSRDPDELRHLWVEWHNAIGTPNVRRMFQEYVRYMNEAAQLNNEEDAGQMWLSDYETDDMKEQLQILWEQIRPLYLQLHAYVRLRLRVKYGNIVSEKGPIPVHLLGDMWGKSWKAVMNFSIPYPRRKQSNVTRAMIKQGYTPLKIFQTADDFFVSLNLSEVPETFWNKSVFEKPTDRKMMCQSSAWDFYDGKDFRIKMCARVDEESLIVAHHEMGHIQYYMQYKNLPNIYRAGANSGFHEAVGDTIALSVSTLKHLNKLGLHEDDTFQTEDLLNNLYRNGLTKIAALPFAYLVDRWRWDVFSGKIKPDEYNCKWWELRHEIQGIESPVDRMETDFDPVSKYHILANIPYIRYFISYILQFQFHKALCEKAGVYVPEDPTKPLHECDIYDSKEAGNAFGAMMQLGASKPWQDAMQTLTGQRNMDASGLMEYFDPLMKWLIEENKKTRAFVGWEHPTKNCRNDEKRNSE